MLHNIVQFPNSVSQKMKRREPACNNSDFAKQTSLRWYRRNFKFRTNQFFTYRFLKGPLLYFSTNSLTLGKTVGKSRKTVQPRVLHGNSKYSPAFQLGDCLSLLSRCLFRLALLFCCFLESEKLNIMNETTAAKHFKTTIFQHRYSWGWKRTMIYPETASCQSQKKTSLQPTNQNLEQTRTNRVKGGKTIEFAYDWLRAEARFV